MDSILKDSTVCSKNDSQSNDSRYCMIEEENFQDFNKEVLSPSSSEISIIDCKNSLIVLSSSENCSEDEKILKKDDDFFVEKFNLKNSSILETSNDSSIILSEDDIEINSSKKKFNFDQTLTPDKIKFDENSKVNSFDIKNNSFDTLRQKSFDSTKQNSFDSIKQNSLQKNFKTIDKILDNEDDANFSLNTSLYQPLDCEEIMYCDDKIFEKLNISLNNNELSIIYTGTPKKVLNKTSKDFSQILNKDNLDDENILNFSEIDKPINFNSSVNNRIKRKKLTEEELIGKDELKKRKKNEKEELIKQKKLEREEILKQKEKLKLKNQKIKELNNILNLKNSSQHCKTIISQTIIDNYLTTKTDSIKDLFKESNLNYEIENLNQPIVKWQRVLHNVQADFNNTSVLNLENVLSKEELEEDYLIYVINKENIVNMAYKFLIDTNQLDDNDFESESLLSFVKKLIEIKKKSFVFIIYNLESYFRSLKNKEHQDFIHKVNDQVKQKKKKSSKLPIVNKNNIEDAILNSILEIMKNDTYVELKLKIKFLFAESQIELINLIHNLSISMSDAPYKRWRNLQEGFDWFVDGDCKSGSVNIKEIPNDINKLWIKHLLLFDKISLPVAKSIAEKYSSIGLLNLKYKSLNTEEEKETFLSKIVMNNNRSINNDISKRIYKFLTEKNENEILV